MAKIEVHLTHAPILLDEEDYELFQLFNWRIVDNRVACDIKDSEGKWRRVLLHRLLLGLTPEDPRVDHIDGNTFNNQRSNLRLSDAVNNALNTNIVNNRGTSKYRGVSWNKERQKWQARVQANGRKYQLGYYQSELGAMRKLAKWRVENGYPVGYELEQTSRS